MHLIRIFFGPTTFYPREADGVSVGGDPSGGPVRPVS